jgi:DNA-binding NarL/FixJ family response regulator
MHADEAYITQILHAGPAGTSSKDSAARRPHSLPSKRSAQGKSFFSPAVARLMLDDYVKQRNGEPSIVDRYETLSDREREVFQLIAEGRRTRTSPACCSLSPSTVETHRAHIMEKLDVHSAPEIVLYAVRRGIIR